MNHRLSPTEHGALRDGYRQPSRPSAFMPFWAWTGALTPEELADQVDEFLSRGIAAATILCFPGHVGGFLGERYFAQLDAVIERARRGGFEIWIHPEYGWPVGEGRYVGPRGPGSRTLEAMPSARMRELRRADRQVGDSWVAPEEGVVAMAAAPLGADGEPRLDLLVEIPMGGLQLAGPWLVSSSSPEKAFGIDSGAVDMMSGAATEVYIEQVLEPIAQRYAADLGTTLVGLYLDHEGDYGGRMPWTPLLFETFERRYGYRLQGSLPLLGADTPAGRRVRRDYLALAGSLYAECFFGPITAWAERHGLVMTGHIWEEKLQMMAAHIGDFYAVQRAMSFPGVDSLLDWGESPRHIKEAASVAALTGRTLSVESNGCLGMDGQRDPERLRRVTGALAVWGATHLVHAGMGANVDQVQFPPDSRAQPWWPDFGAYVGYARRLADINAGSVLQVDLAILHPRDDFLADSWPLFRRPTGEEAEARQARPWTLPPTDARSIFRLSAPDSSIWTTDADDRDAEYGELMERLVEHQRDFLAIDLEALVAAPAGNGSVVLGGSRVRALVLPRMRFVTRALALAVRRLHDAGVMVIRIGAARPDAVDSTVAGEAGALLDTVFGQNGRGLTVASVDEVAPLLDARVPAPCRVVSGPRSQIRIAQRRSLDADIWTVWSAATEPIDVRLALASDAPEVEVWDPEDGSMTPAGSPADVGLRLGPGVAVHLVAFRTAHPVAPIARPAARSWELTGPGSPTAGLAVDGPWQLECVDPVRIGRVDTCVGDQPDGPWVSTVLGVGPLAVRDWMVTGPFDNIDWSGVATAFGPEHGVDLDARYEGLAGPVGWVRHSSPLPFVNLDAAVSGTVGIGVFDRPATGYAYAVIRSDTPRELVLNVVNDTCVDVWLDGRSVLSFWDHRHYVEPTGAFAYRAPISIPAGESSILVKTSRDRRAFLGGMGFMLWFTEPDGQAALSLRVGPPGAAGSEVAPSRVWHRFRVPQGTGVLEMPKAVDRLVIDGVTVPVEVDVQVHPGEEVLLGAHGAIHEPIVLTGARTPAELGSWTPTDLRSFVGRARYRTGFVLPAGDLAGIAEPVLDLGDAGATARVRLNGIDLGVRIWRPLRFDLSSALRPGWNELEIEVANTEAPGRAEREPFRLWRDVVTAGPDLLPNLERNGLLGPVTVVWTERSDR